MSNATAPPPSLTCPAWCTRDHESVLARLTRNFDTLVRAGGMGRHEADQRLQADTDESRTIHTTSFGAGATSVGVEISESDPDIYAISVSGRELDATACREYAMNLLLAARLIEGAGA